MGRVLRVAFPELCRKRRRFGGEQVWDIIYEGRARRLSSRNYGPFDCTHESGSCEGWVCTFSGASLKKFVFPSTLSCNGLVVERDVSIDIDGRCSVQVLDRVQDIPAPAENSPWIDPAVVLDSVSCMLLCDGVRLDTALSTDPPLHHHPSTRPEEWGQQHDQDCSESWRALRSSQCPILFSRSATGRSHVCPSCQKLRRSLTSLSSTVAPSLAIV